MPAEGLAVKANASIAQRLRRCRVGQYEHLRIAQRRNNDVTAEMHGMKVNASNVRSARGLEPGHDGKQIRAS